MLLVEVRDRVATLTLHRPAARNALSSELITALRAAPARLDGDDDVDVVVRPTGGCRSCGCPSQRSRPACGVYDLRAEAPCISCSVTSPSDLSASGHV